MHCARSVATHLSQYSSIYTLSTIKVCSYIFKLVAADRKLWLTLYVTMTARPGFPARTPPTPNRTASDIEAWLRVAVTLDKVETWRKPHSVQRNSGLKHVTWAKLVRGRWCLVAGSNIHESHLWVYDLSEPSISEDSLALDIAFSGPVIDGTVDDSANEITLALTIGTRYVSLSQTLGN